jgi:pimeloyl-ACP methyl ester carboxylesterase
MFSQERIVVQSADGTALSLQKSGSGPALLLVHGSASVSASWAAVIPALNQRFTVYALDRRGRAPSGDASKYSFDAEVDDLAAVAASVSGPVKLAAHSYGALIAVRAAATPGKLKNVTRLILYEPPVSVKPRPEHAKMVAEMNRAWENGDRDRVAAVFLQEILGLAPARLAAFKASPAWPGIVSIAETYPREAEAAGRFEVSAQDLAGWKTPTTMLLGGQSPDYMREGTQFVCGAMPNCKVAMLDGQGHMAIQIAPALFVSKLLEAIDAP